MNNILYMVYGMLGLFALSTAFSTIAMFHLSAYGKSNWWHFFFKFKARFDRNYFTDRGWEWQRRGIIIGFLMFLYFLIFAVVNMIRG
jgi:hypothetical protein